METDVKKNDLATILEAILSDKNLSFENVNKFLNEGKNSLEELLKIDSKDAERLLGEFIKCEETVKGWKKDLNDEEKVKGQFKEEGCNLGEKDKPTGYKLFKHRSDKDKDKNLIKINKFITYCDMHGDGIGTEGYNTTGIVMALAIVMQNAWVKNLLKYIIKNQDENIDNRVIRAIKYFQEPDKYLSIISENHLDLISQYYLGYKANDADLINYFNEIFANEISNNNQAYKNKLYTEILYDETEKKELAI